MICPSLFYQPLTPCVTVSVYIDEATGAQYMLLGHHTAAPLEATLSWSAWTS